MTRQRSAWIKAALTGAAFLASAARADAPLLVFPVDCTLGETCFLQQFVDRDPGPGARDFTCGPLSYDTHQGSDIRVTDLEAMEAGVSVIAAAPGTVRATRDGVPDLGRAAMPEGQDCGNGVAITHGDGWETQYCHLRMNSVAVAHGDRVEAGTPLGLIGFSGNTEFPHLHLTLRHEGRVIDPFDPSDTASCGGGAAQLWADPITPQMGGFISAGFADAIPDYDAIKAGTADAASLSARQAPALVVWGFLFGGQAGDQVRLSITGPDGAVIHSQTTTLERTQIQLFRASGRRTPPQGWQAGPYLGDLTLERGGTLIDRIETRVMLD
ncbi:M23 family metallopeptidase [Rhodophyticola sp. CCM32]|uniref:M23 family metallopeptidase n=1 Tax=Rhodophyticola sp. CCM32 TaxID=2916397 RepID=UPI00107F8443|nr:M23 family metallopeptidase [Rhodophyticola sp. CCM32]QBX99678.1 M23 family metallopeptidase [Rhodophyticola sp. CCM32]